MKSQTVLNVNALITACVISNEINFELTKLHQVQK